MKMLVTKPSIPDWDQFDDDEAHLYSNYFTSWICVLEPLQSFLSWALVKSPYMQECCMPSFQFLVCFSVNIPSLVKGSSSSLGLSHKPMVCSMLTAESCIACVWETTVAKPWIQFSAFPLFSLQKYKFLENMIPMANTSGCTSFSFNWAETILAIMFVHLFFCNINWVYISGTGVEVILYSVWPWRIDGSVLQSPGYQRGGLRSID